MSKRKNVRIEAQQRLDWLRRSEQGESPPAIAADKYDVRTVRKHIALARREREVKEARAVVVRDALERHYKGMVSFAQKLRKSVSGDQALPADFRDDPYWAALKQHQPQSPLWKLLARWDRILDELKQSEGLFEARLEADLRSDTRLKGLPSSHLESAVNGIVAALLFQASRWGRGEPGLNLGDNFKKTSAEGGLFKVEYGAFNMDEQTAGGADVIEKAITDYETNVTSWKEYRDLTDLIGQMLAIKKKALDQLTVVIMKGVVPGQCKYCPL